MTTKKKKEYLHDFNSPLSFSFEIAPITINHAYVFKGWKKFPTKEHTFFKRFIADEIEKYRGSVDLFKANISATQPINCKIDFFLFRHLTKKNEISLKGNDIDNLLKVTIDAVFSALEINDALICNLFVTKSQSKKDQSHFQIEISY